MAASLPQLLGLKHLCFLFAFNWRITTQGFRPWGISPSFPTNLKTKFGNTGNKNAKHSKELGNPRVLFALYWQGSSSMRWGLPEDAQWPTAAWQPEQSEVHIGTGRVSRAEVVMLSARASDGSPHHRRLALLTSTFISGKRETPLTCHKIA